MSPPRASAAAVRRLDKRDGGAADFARLVDFDAPGEPDEDEGGTRAGGDRDIVGSVLRAFDVLKVFSRSKPRMTLSEVAEYSGLSRASARRFLLTFVHAGYMETDGKRFQPTPKLLELGYAVVAGSGLWDVARPLLSELSQSLGESCFGAVLDGNEVLYVVHAQGASRFVNVGIRVGSRLPAYCTSIGRVLLSGLSDDALEQVLADIRPEPHTARTVTAKAKLRSLIEQTRRVGWSIVEEELEVGLSSISAPIKARDGSIIAAINVCGPSPRVSVDDLRVRFLPELLACADRIERAMRD